MIYRILIARIITKSCQNFLQLPNFYNYLKYKYFFKFSGLIGANIREKLSVNFTLYDGDGDGNIENIFNVLKIKNFLSLA